MNSYPSTKMRNSYLKATQDTKSEWTEKPFFKWKDKIVKTKSYQLFTYSSGKILVKMIRCVMKE